MNLLKYSVRIRLLLPLALIVLHGALYLETDAYQWVLAGLVPKPVVHYLADRYTGQFEEVPWMTARFASAFVAALLFCWLAISVLFEHFSGKKKSRSTRRLP